MYCSVNAEKESLFIFMYPLGNNIEQRQERNTAWQSLILPAQGCHNLSLYEDTISGEEQPCVVLQISW